MKYTSKDIDRLMGANNLTDQEFADKLGVSRELLNKMRNEKLPISKATQVLLREFEEKAKGSEKNSEKNTIPQQSMAYDDTRDLINHLKETNADLKNERDKLSKRIEELEKKVLGCLAKLEEKQERAYWFEIEAHSIIIGEFDPDGKKKLLQTFYTNAVQRVTAEREKGSLLKSDMTGMQV